MQRDEAEEPMPINYGGIDLVHMTFEDVGYLHDCFAYIFRNNGITGHELDRAISSCVIPSIRAIEAKREELARRRASKPHLVYSAPLALNQSIPRAHGCTAGGDTGGAASASPPDQPEETQQCRS